MLRSLFNKSKEYNYLLEEVKNNNFPIANFGFNENSFVLQSLALFQELGSAFILVENDSLAKEIYDKISELEDNVALLRTREISFYTEYSHSYQIETERLESLYSAMELDNYILVASISSILATMPDPKDFLNARFDINVGEEYDFSELTAKLVEFGYDRMDIVEAKGQFLIKGGIIDIFPVLYDKPIRLDFFGDELYKIKEFDVASQISDRELESVKIRACASSFKDKISLDDNDKFTVFDYVKNFNILTFSLNRQILRAEEIYEEYLIRLKEEILENRANSEDKNLMLSFDDVVDRLKNSRLISFTRLKSNIKEIDPKVYIDCSINDLPKYFSDLEQFIKDVKSWQTYDYLSIIAYSSDFQKNRISELFDENDIFYAELENFDVLSRSDSKGKVFFIDAPYIGGFIDNSNKIAFVTPFELYQKKSVKKKRKLKKREKIKAFSEIELGDYVVHESYGIGRYAGIFLKDFAGEEKDMIKIEYKNDEVLFIPVESLNTLHKYIGKDKGRVELHSLSSKKWQRQKAKAKESVDKIAKDLVELYAKRREQKGYAFPPDDVWQNEFEESFPYTETAGQMQASYEIKEDMQKPYPMERLLCGDVGYGKTEVALRGIFKCISNGKQACVLVPTTILAEQHFISMSSRLKDYPLEIAVLSRFKTKKEQKEILERLKTGVVDLIIGTHRLLSKDVVFKDLGLLVVDEEQRFGVSHKEKIKELKVNVDSLSMSATPIPRTLNMSLIGVKDLSIIEDPPEDRFPIQTYVMEYNSSVLKEVLRREVSRGGQVYYVHNRVDDLARIFKNLSELMPDLSFAIAHGKMSETALEDVILAFMDGEYDVLISTSIIETGLDIPNVNTIVIDDCDRYGLSQLYQLRGRVGRSNRLGYAYLFYDENKVLTEISEKRLKAIKEFSSLGSGYKLSMKDLELRGSGNIFGKAQSGHISEIGYEMYAKLLEETIEGLKGKKEVSHSDCKVEFNCSAYISEDYIDDYRFRIEMYKRISMIEDVDERREIVDEMTDRFGSVPIETSHLTYVALIRKMASSLGFNLVKQDGKKINLYYSMDNDLDLKQVYDILSQVNESEVKFVAGEKPYFSLDYQTEDIFVMDLMEYTVDFLGVANE